MSDTVDLTDGPDGIEGITENESAVKNTHTDEDNVCPICQEVWGSGGRHRVAALQCGHLFGLSCIQEWGSNARTDRKRMNCPICRKEFAKQVFIPLVVSSLPVRGECTAELDSVRKELDALKLEHAGLQVASADALADLARTKRDLDISNAQLREHAHLRERAQLRELAQGVRAGAGLPTCPQAASRVDGNGIHGPLPFEAGVGGSGRASSCDCIYQLQCSLPRQSLTAIEMDSLNQQLFLATASEHHVAILKQSLRCPGSQQRILLPRGLGPPANNTPVASIKGLSLHESSRLLAAAGGSAGIDIVHVDQGQSVSRVGTELPCRAVCWQTQQNTIFWAALGTQVRMYDTRSLRAHVLAHTLDDTPVYSIHATATGILCGTLKGAYYVHNAQTNGDTHLIAGARPGMRDRIGTCESVAISGGGDDFGLVLASFREGHKAPPGFRATPNSCVTVPHHHVLRPVASPATPDLDWRPYKQESIISGYTSRHTMTQNGILPVVATWRPGGGTPCGHIICGSDEATNSVRIWDVETSIKIGDLPDPIGHGLAYAPLRHILPRAVTVNANGACSDWLMAVLRCDASQLPAASSVQVFHMVA